MLDPLTDQLLQIVARVVGCRNINLRDILTLLNRFLRLRSAYFSVSFVLAQHC